MSSKKFEDVGNGVSMRNVKDVWEFEFDDRWSEESAQAFVDSIPGLLRDMVDSAERKGVEDAG